MIQTMPVTTADVAAAPTAAALRPHCMPRRQPARATRAPKSTLLHRPRPQVDQVDGLAGLIDVFHQREVEEAGANEEAGQHPQHIGIHTEQGHHQHQRQHARQHQKLHGRDAHGGQGIDLFIDLHGAELRRIRRARAPGHDDAGHDRPHFARHAQPDQVGDIDLGAKLPQLDGPHKGQDQANEKADEGHNAQGLHPRFLHEEGQIDAPEAGLAGHQPATGEDDLPQEVQQVPGALPAGEHRGPDAGEPGEAWGPAPRAFALRDGGGQGQETSDAFGEPLLIDDDLPVRARLQHLAHKGEEPGVPGRHGLRLEGEPPHRRAGVELLIHVGHDGRAGVDRPVPHEVHQQGVVRPTLAPECTRCGGGLPPVFTCPPSLGASPRQRWAAGGRSPGAPRPRAARAPHAGDTECASPPPSRPRTRPSSDRS